MTDAQKLATKKFLHSMKAMIMAMDVETLKDDQIAAVYNDFVTLSNVASIESEGTTEEK